LRAEPNPVNIIEAAIDSANVTLKWPLPEGRIDFYIVSWKLEEPLGDLDNEDDDEENEKIIHSGSKNISSADVTQNDGKIGILIGELIPGAKYTFEVFTTSHGLKSETTALTSRTSKFLYSYSLASKY